MNSISHRSFSFITLFLALIFLFSACASSAVNIPDNLSPAELVQRAQEASDRNRYNTALQYYEALLERYSYNINMVCTAEYEIAFIHYKQKKYTEARTGFNNLLERYNTPDAELLPQQFKRLSMIVLERMDEKEKSKVSLFKSKKE